jgi:putative membrane protein
MEKMIDMMDGMMGGGWIAMLLGLFLILILIAALIWGVVYFTRRTGESGNGPEHGRERSADILKERYARVDIDREEFEERRRALQA